MNRTDIINRLIKFHGYRSYLEIGVAGGDNIRAVNCRVKLGVDPNPQCDQVNFMMTSDEYFDEVIGGPNSGGLLTTMFDIIFIDGDHLEAQVDKDVENSLRHLNVNGTIVLHDCNPPSEEYAGPHPLASVNYQWNGTVYKTCAKITMHRPTDLKFFAVDCDWGVGILTKKDSDVARIVRPFASPLGTFQGPTWEEFASQRNEFLKLISPEKFLSRFPL